MSEIRTNPFTGEMTLYAENRKNRPYEFKHSMLTTAGTGENCPFCGGHEDRTPTALYQDAPDKEWQIRVFPNMFPAVSESYIQQDAEPFYEQQGGIGTHELLVDTREHTQTIDAFSLKHMEKVLKVLQERSAAILAKEHTAYVQIFKNCGPSAGMSIRHSHWQLIGVPLVPRRVHTMAVKMQKEDCLFCKMLSYEAEHDTRIAGQTEGFLAITPYASRFPYEIWIAPKVHQSRFSDMQEAERKELAHLLWEVLQKVILLREDVGYNICVMDAPKGMDFHWHIQILPRIGGFAGFEYATDCFINLVKPEKAAGHYRGEE